MVAVNLLAGVTSNVQRPTYITTVLGRSLFARWEELICARKHDGNNCIKDERKINKQNGTLAKQTTCRGHDGSKLNDIGWVYVHVIYVVRVDWCSGTWRTTRKDVKMRLNGPLLSTTSKTMYDRWLSKGYCSQKLWFILFRQFFIQYDQVAIILIIQYYYISFQHFF